MTGDSEFRATFLRIVGGQDQATVDPRTAVAPAPPVILATVP